MSSIADEVENWMREALRCITNCNDELALAPTTTELLDRIRQLEKDAELGSLVKRMSVFCWLERGEGGNEWMCGECIPGMAPTVLGKGDTPEETLRAALSET